MDEALLTQQQNNLQSLYIQNMYQVSAPTMSIITETVDKLLARTSSHILLQDIFSQANHYAEDFVLSNAMSEIICKSSLPTHDYENDIINENMDCEEPYPSELDVYATFHLKVKKTTIISKYNQKDTTPMGENAKYTLTYKGPSSIYSMNMKLQQKSLKHLGDKGDDILPKPLINTRLQEEDRLILNYRKKKEKEEKLKEEEKIKQEALEQRLRELDEKGNAKDDKNMKKRLVTYDSKGDVIFIKNFRADVLPNPLINPPYKIKIQKQQQNRGGAESQQSDYFQTQRGSHDDSTNIRKKPLKNEKTQLLQQIDIPQIKNEIIPMGSVFNDTEPAEGIKIGEAGKFKYGSMNLSKRMSGQMSLEEYKIQKDQVILQAEMLETQKSFNRTGKMIFSTKVDEQQTIDLEQTKDNHSENKQFDLKLKQVTMNIPVLNLDSLNQSQMGQTMRVNYSQLDMSANQNYYQTQSALQTSRLTQDRDRVIRKKDGLENFLILDGKKSNAIHDSEILEQSSYIDNFKQQQRQVSFATTQIFDSKQYRFSSQLATARHTSSQRHIDLEYNLKNNKVLPPLLTNRKAMEQGNELGEILMNKNNEIMMNNNWGQNPSDLNKIPKRIERKPKIFEMKKSNSLLQLTNRKKERNYIEQIKQRQHLPPPPLGKTFGHGISQLPTILNFNQSQMKFL